MQKAIQIPGRIGVFALRNDKRQTSNIEHPNLNVQ